MTDKKTPLATEPEKKPEKKIHTKAPVTRAPGTKTPDTKTPDTKATAKKVSTNETTTNGQNKVSKLAIVAIIIAIVITIVHYFWQQQQSQLLTLKLSQQIDHKSTATFDQYQAETNQALTKQQKTFANKLQQITTQVNDNNQVEKVAELNTLLSELERKVKQRQPSDWILHEAEY
ncbi:MAG: hypothetical protein QNK36_18880, partial [Colwellia sp.]|nr:hypothetical protein [Colwellia sp.]